MGSFQVDKIFASPAVSASHNMKDLIELFINYLSVERGWRITRCWLTAGI